jgi:DnaJ-domain-containing protein 1
MEAQRYGSVCIKLLSIEALERQRAAEFRFPELLAALDLAQKRYNNAMKPLEYKKPESKPAAEKQKEEAPEQKEDELPTDALAALAKYQQESQGASLPPSYEELQEAMGKESWTKWRKGMGPQEWLEMMGIARVEQDDPYKVLGVDPTASQEELKIAFRERAREFHPDKFPDDPESAAMRFDCIKKCYDRVRTEDARAKTDKQMGITDFFSLYMSEERSGRQRMMAQMIAIKDDPDALPREAGLDDDLKRQGSAVVKYYHYKLPFKVSNCRLAVADIDGIYGVKDAFPDCSLMLAEWRRGDCHILRPGDADTGESAILKQEQGCFCDVQPGKTYHLLVQEKA